VFLKHYLKKTQGERGNFSLKISRVNPGFRPGTCKTKFPVISHCPGYVGILFIINQQSTIKEIIFLVMATILNGLPKDYIG
jgi:hypothetical protein